jgi:hypothetical protein
MPTLWNEAHASDSWSISGGNQPMRNITQRSDDQTQAEVSLVARSPSVIEPSKVGEDDFELIRSRFGDPRATNVRPDDYYTFRMIASGDGLDSYYTKQDTETSFPNFVRDLKMGQSLLGNHAAATFAYGNSYDGMIMPADPSRSEYEPTFYPRWDRPELRTQNWLVGKYFVPRGIELNGQKTDDLIRGIELGSQRKASISFVVGQYTCGIDGLDLIQTWFGPMPSEECTHFPGLEYDGQIAWSLMKDNVLLETSLVYKNASPSSMLLRKAEVMAARGAISDGDIVKLEERYQFRLPSFDRRIWTVPNKNDQEDTMAKRSVDPVVDAVREVLVDESPESAPEPTQDAEDRLTVTTTVSEGEGTTEVATTTVEAGADDAEDVTATASVEAGDDDDEDTERSAESESSASVEASDERSAESDQETDEATEEESAESNQDIVAEFVETTDRLVAALSRNSDAFDGERLSGLARAERTLDIALIDAGCDSTVGSHVARAFETRSKAIRETLGEPLTVEAIRSLQQRANLGDKLFADLVRDAVAARTGVQGENFNGDKYRDVLLATRDVDYVKDEITSWKSGKSDRFTAGRQVVPPQVPAARTTKEERKSLPVRPGDKAQSNGADGNLLSPRSKS